MIWSKRAVGNQAEEAAAKYLSKHGYKIIKRNFLIRGGEIDIIAKDQKTLVFVEVKARSSNRYGSGLEAITSWKLEALHKAALFYMQTINWGDQEYRFDAVEVDLAVNPFKIDLIKNILN